MLMTIMRMKKKMTMVATKMTMVVTINEQDCESEYVPNISRVNWKGNHTNIHIYIYKRYMDIYINTYVTSI